MFGRALNTFLQVNLQFKQTGYFQVFFSSLREKNTISISPKTGMKVHNYYQRNTISYHPGGFIVNFEHISHLFSRVSIINFEHVIAGWAPTHHFISNVKPSIF